MIQVKKLSILGLSHISLGTKDLEVAEYFYTKVLCGEIVFRFINSDNNFCYGIFLSMGNGSFLEIFNNADNVQIEKSDFPYRHICFRVESVDQACKWLEQHNIATEVKVGKIDKVKQFFINGPDNVLIEFHEYGQESPQFKFL